MILGIPIFTYHYFGYKRIAQAGIKEEDLAFVTLKETFEQHLRFLNDNNYATISMATLADGLKEPSILPSKPVVLTIDDGHHSVIDYAYPLLQQHGCSAELFVITDRIGKPGYLDWNQLKELTGRGIGVQSHGKSHHLLNRLTDAEREIELVESRVTIEGSIGQPVTAFAVPKGGYPRRLGGQILSAGYTLCCTSYHGICKTESNPVALRRIMIKHPYDSVSGLLQLMNPFSIPSASRNIKSVYKYLRNLAD